MLAALQEAHSDRRDHTDRLMVLLINTVAAGFGVEDKHGKPWRLPMPGERTEPSPRIGDTARQLAQGR